jgi:hypothetical protein
VPNDSTKTELSHEMEWKTIPADWVFHAISDGSCIDFLVNIDSLHQEVGTAMSIGVLSDHCEEGESADEKQGIRLKLRNVGGLSK